MLIKNNPNRMLNLVHLKKIGLLLSGEGAEPEPSELQTNWYPEPELHKNDAALQHSKNI
jgi:hypothetical protein